jgi:hypothetical protein
MESADVLDSVIEAVAQYLKSNSSPGYHDAVESSRYMGFSLREFNGEIAPFLPCIRLKPTGKRMYAKKDLDEFMMKRRVVPKDAEKIDNCRFCHSRGARLKNSGSLLRLAPNPPSCLGHFPI